MKQASTILRSIHKLGTLITLSIALMFAALAPQTAHAQVKKPAPAPAKAAPAKPAAKPAAPAARPSAPAAAHGPTTSGPTTASHGPTTSSPTTASHGPTTGAPHGAAPTTAGRPGTPEHAAAPGGRPGAEHAGGAPGGRAGPAMHGPMGHPAPAGARDMRAANGSAVRMRPGGRPSDFHDARRGMDIHHNLAGGRRGMLERPDHSRVFFERGRPGYINHPYMYHGHEFGRRTYYWHGRAYDRFYRPYGFHGIGLEVYAPVRFYPIGFYGWAYHPWAVSIHYGWGWTAAPWYGYYGRAYFEPYPVYAGPNYWLTDYLISQSLEAQYEAQLAAGAPPPLADATPLTPEIKQQIADEVQRQLALESAEAQQNAQGQEPDPASSGIARMLSDGQPHVFVAGDEVDVTDTSGQECAVTEGDVLQLANQPGPNDTTAQLVVVASKGGPDCHKRAIVNVAFDDLQNMQNHMRETVDRGLEDLQAKQGTGGLPPAPPSAKAPPTTTEFAQLAPPPDPAGAADVDAAAGQADQSEKEVLAAANGGDSSATDGGTQAPAPIVSIALGQSIDEVQTSLGQPTRIVNLGPKAIYFYKDMKVTFVNGKVTNIE